MKTEPTAEIRQAAYALWQVFVALVNEGFSEDQAVKIVAALLANQRRSDD